MAITRPSNETQALYPAKIALATDGVISEETPPDGVPVQGVPLGIFKDVLHDNGTFAAAVQVLVDPPMDPGQYTQITLELNGVQIGVPQAVGNETIAFDLFQSDLRDGVTNVLQYILKTHAGNENRSTELWALYSATLPGGNDVPGSGEHPGLGLSLPAEWGDPANIDKDKIDNKVPLTLAYSHMKAHDKVTVEVGNERFDFTVKPGEVGASFVALIDREQFELVGSQDNCPFSYTVVDQLLNAAHKRRWSKIIRANVDVDGVTLNKPILREILDDSEDEATEIDLGKLAGKNLLVLVSTRSNHFNLRDKIKAEYIARIEGQIVGEENMEGIVEADVIGDKKLCVLEVPNTEVIAGSSVTVTYALFTRDDHPVGKSETATATVVGEALPPAVLGFTNAPYTVSAGGELGPVNLRLTRTGAPVANATVGLTLPAGFTYANGGGGARDFTTDAKGEVSVTGVKGAEVEGELELVAVSEGAPLVRAQVVVSAPGPVGVIDMGGPQNSVVITSDGARIYVELASVISVVETKTNDIIGHILKPSEMYGSRRIFISANDKKIYAAPNFNNINIFDANSYKFIKKIEDSTDYAAMSRDGMYLTYMNRVGAAIHFDTNTDSIINSIRTVAGAHPILYNLDGSIIYSTFKPYAHQFTIYASKTITGENILQYTFSGAPNPSSLYGSYLSADGDHIYLDVVLQPNNEWNKSLIVMLDAHTLQEQRRFTTPDYSRISQVFSDRIYLYNPKTTSIAILDIVSEKIVNHIEVGHEGARGNTTYSVCTPDEKRLFACNRWGPLLAVVHTEK